MNTNATKYLLEYRDKLLQEADELTKPYEEQIKVIKSVLHDKKIIANQKKKLANEVLGSITSQELSDFAEMQKTIADWEYQSIPHEKDNK